ncbi:MAG TPA: zf-TFIIB domain-containing protein [Thermoanaerobaculaceae bacterium]|nr:zf-TFIIB domain-containing protein [Thermoanaerobaculaceae bacterium]
MDCPVCHEPLIVAEREGIELDACPWCHGLWFDAGELALLAETLGRTLSVGEGGAIAAGPTAEKPRPCPRCDKAMEKVTLGQSPRVLLDRCPSHGLWFDHGELGSLMGQMRVSSASHPEAVLRFMGETFGTAAPQSSSTTAGAAGEVER